MLNLTQPYFPKFSKLAADSELEEVLPGASAAEIAEIEAEVGVHLPESYKRLLQCARGFWLMGGVVQFGQQHPFAHEFPPFDSLPPAHRQSSNAKVAFGLLQVTECSALQSASCRLMVIRSCSIQAKV